NLVSQRADEVDCVLHQCLAAKLSQRFFPAHAQGFAAREHDGGYAQAAGSSSPSFFLSSGVEALNCTMLRPSSKRAGSMRSRTVLLAARCRLRQMSAGEGCQ